MPSTWRACLMAGAAGALALSAPVSQAGDPLASQHGPKVFAQNDAYSPNDHGDRRDGDYTLDDAYAPRGGDRYDDRDERYEPDHPRDDGSGYGEPYEPPRARHGNRGYDDRDGEWRRDSYSETEIFDAGKRFFGSISEGLARVVEHAFKRQGRPNGYILGEDAGGAFVAGLRYGEGVLYTKYDGDHKVFWQGPSVGYDFGGEGSKTMVLVYNLHDPSDIFRRFPGVEGSAYLIGGVGIEFKKNHDIVVAPIRAGVGLRLGANVGYLKYTRSPTINPF